MNKMVILGGSIAALALSACATADRMPPVEVTRYHFDAVADRGTVNVEPLPGGGTPSIEFQTYAAAVQTELLKQGFTAPAPGATAQYLAVVSYRRAERALPPKPAPFSIGIGGGSFSGGRHGGVGLGGGVGFPIGGGKRRLGVATELSVQLRHGPDAVWEGTAQSLTDLSRTESTANEIADKLAHALFTGFPGESGRTIEVK